MFKKFLNIFSSAFAAGTYTAEPVKADEALTIPKDVRDSMKAPDNMARMFRGEGPQESDAIAMQEAILKRNRKGAKRTRDLELARARSRGGAT